MASVQGSDLSLMCTICRDIRFDELAWQTVEYQRAKPPLKYDLGTIYEVRSRQQSCELCRAIMGYLNSADSSHGPTSPGDRLEVGSHLFASAHREDMNRWKPHDPYLQIQHITINLVPAGHQGLNQTMGPALPPDFYLPHVNTLKQPEDIRTSRFMSFHTCTKPVPSVEGFCSDEPQKVGATNVKFGGRVRSNQIDLRLPSRWLRLCQERHGSRCRPISPLSGSLQDIPGLRLIDVKNLCVIKAPSKCEYCALSYCWGQSANFICTRSNVKSLEFPAALVLDRLPRTIRHAIQITGALGVRYLWVDALCIVQDDEAMIACQIPLMSQIYERATATIIAASGDDSHHGLAGVDLGTRNVERTIIKLPNLDLLQIIDDGSYDGLRQSRWQTRAWTMQEELFSRRRLVFTPQQMYWQCKCAFWMEEFELESAREEISFNRPTGGWNPDFPELPFDIKDFDQALYRQLVREYLRKTMTYAADSLRAFAGVMTALSKGTEQQILWGIPEKFFSRALEWQAQSAQQRHLGNERIKLPTGDFVSVPFPSWSWSAWKAESLGSSVYWQAELYDWKNTATIVFYRCGANGPSKRVVEVYDPPPIHHYKDLPNGNTVEIRQEYDEGNVDGGVKTTLWVGSPREIEDASNEVTECSFVDSGLLKCWTSVAALYIRRKRTNQRQTKYWYTLLNDKGVDILEINVHLQSTAHIAWQDRKRQETLPPKVREYSKESDVFAIHSVVIGKSDFSHVSVLLVEWEKGIGYRLGFVTMTESTWISLDREWKLVTLG